MTNNNLKELKEDFDKKRLIYKRFLDKFQKLVVELLEREERKFHATEARVKDWDSFSEKISRKNYTDPFKEMPDIAGMRIIAYYADDIEIIRELLNSEFKIYRKDTSDKLQEMDEDQIGYLSVHEVASFKANRCELPEYSDYKDLKIEIQMRSVCQHAWASISHELGYKEEKYIPRQLRRELFLISGLLEIADHQFINLRTKTEELEKYIEEEIKDDKLDKIPINKNSLKVYLTTSPTITSLFPAGDHKKFIKDRKLFPHGEKDFLESTALCWNEGNKEKFKKFWNTCEEYLLKLCSIYKIDTLRKIDKILIKEKNNAEIVVKKLKFECGGICRRYYDYAVVSILEKSEYVKGINIPKESITANELYSQCTKSLHELWLELILNPCSTDENTDS